MGRRHGVRAVAICMSALLLAGCGAPGGPSRATADAVLVAIRDGNRPALESRFWPGYGGKDTCLVQLLEQRSLKGVDWRVGIARQKANESVAVVNFSHPVITRGRRWEALRLVLVRDTREGRALLIYQGARLPAGRGKPTGRWLVILAVPVPGEARGKEVRSPHGSDMSGRPAERPAGRTPRGSPAYRAGDAAATGAQATTPTAVGDPWTHPAKLGLLSPDYSVVRAFIEAAWTKKGPLHQEKVFPGAKARVDTRIGPWTFPAGELLPGLGDPVTVVYLGGSDHLYRDRHGVRLILETHTFPDTLILSAQCKHAAQLIRRDLRSLRTESGAGLGDSEARLLKLLGSPSRRDRFQGYSILWYLQKPKHVVIEAGAHEYDEGHAAAYALKGGRVVEIWLHEWSNEPIG